MSRLVAVLALCLVPGVAFAQQSRSPAAAHGLPPIGLPLPQIGLPLPSIGLPLPTLGLPPAVQAPRHDGHRQPGRGNDWRRSRGYQLPTIVYFGGPYLPVYEPPVQAPAPGLTAMPPEPVPSPPSGRIRLEIAPVDDLQIYVDGVFVGTLADLGAELELGTGVRRLELRAPGHESLTLDAGIVEGKTITYRGRLQPLAVTTPREAAPRRPEAPASKTAAPPARPQTFYFIPGCYMGNIPPQEVRLPRGCDLSRLITHTP
jgi:hypothetical protein